MMKKAATLLLLLTSVQCFGQFGDSLTLTIPDLTDCSSTSEHWTFTYSNENLEFVNSYGHSVKQLSDGRVNYVWVRDSLDQLLTWFSWVKMPDSIYQGSYSDIYEFVDRVDTSGNEIGFYVGPLELEGSEVSDFLGTAANTKKLADGKRYRQCAYCFDNEIGMRCTFIEVTEFCRCNVPPYNLFLREKREEALFGK